MGKVISKMKKRIRDIFPKERKEEPITNAERQKEEGEAILEEQVEEKEAIPEGQGEEKEAIPEGQKEEGEAIPEGQGEEGEAIPEGQGEAKEAIPEGQGEEKEAIPEGQKKARDVISAGRRKVQGIWNKYRKQACCCAVMAVVAGGAAFWLYCQPRFHDLTVELGTETIDVEAFMTAFADTRNAGIVTDLSTVDIGSVGSIPLTLRSGSRDETVTLTIVDTMPPEVEFIPRLEKTPDYEPDPHDFVASCHDFSPVKVYFVGNVVVPLNYEDQSFTVVVEDACGNAVSQVCTLSIVWLKEEYALELGEQLHREDLLFNSERDVNMLHQGDVDAINGSGTGEYTVASLVDERVCRVRVADTTPPELVTRDVSVFQGEAVTVENFVESCFDASGDIQVHLTTEPDVNVLGIQTMTIEARDVSGNVAISTATLAVVKDKTPPVISGLSALSIEKRSNPDWLSGVSAVDKVDGICEVTCDSRGVDLTTAGTYYVTYTAKDKDGNAARVKRKVVVRHDQEDTNALADSIAAELDGNPEAIRDYVRDTIKYSHDSGGEDPVWHGFTNKSGDCLVHACCLQSLLTRKGYETQLIWVTDRSHYWLIVRLDGVWRHIDATPGVRHTKYSLMTDEQRYSILQGRDWDRSAWPACE